MVTQEGWGARGSQLCPEWVSWLSAASCNVEVICSLCGFPKPPVARWGSTVLASIPQDIHTHFQLKGVRQRGSYMVICSSCCHSNFWTLGQFHQKYKSSTRLEKTAGDRGQSDCARAITTRKNWAQPLLYGSGSNHMLGTSRKAAFICPIAHRANCFIDIHFWWPQRDESSSFFLFKECTLMLLLSGIVPAPTWPPCWALLAPPSWLCLYAAPPKDPWAPLPIVFALSRETFLLPQSLVAVHPLSAVDGLQLIHPPPIWNFHHNKKLRNEAINMYYFNRRLKNKKLLQQLPSQNHGDYCKAENLRNGSCKIYLKAFILSYHNVAKETKYSFPFV